MSDVLYYLVHLVGRLLRVPDVRESLCTVTVFGGIRRDNRHVSPGGQTFHMDRELCPIIHFTLLYIYLVLLYVVFYQYILLHVSIYPACPVTVSSPAREPTPAVY